MGGRPVLCHPGRIIFSYGSDRDGKDDVPLSLDNCVVPRCLRRKDLSRTLINQPSISP
jgi:hypothetical protein